MKPVKQLPRIVVFGLWCLAALAALLALAPQTVLQHGVGVRMLAGAIFSLAFGPYLLAVGCTTGFLPGPGLGVCGPSSGGPEVHERFLFPRMAGGAYTLNNGTKLVVSRGLARESTPLPRFFNHPEVVIVNLRPKM